MEINNKYHVGDKIKTKIHYLNDSRTEVDTIIVGIEPWNILTYRIHF